MIIDKEIIVKLKALHKRKTGVLLSDEEANEMMITLVNATELVFGLALDPQMCDKRDKVLL